MSVVRLTTALVVTLLVAAANCFAGDFGSLHQPEFDLLTPARHQIDIEADDTYQFLLGNNTLRRRINPSTTAAVPQGWNGAISLQNDMGVSQMQVPAVLTSFWFDSVNAAQFQFRYLAPYGNSFSTHPIYFGGTVLSKNQSLNPGGTRWYTFGGYYERRLTPLYQDREQGLPTFLKGWDLRAKIGIEFTYNDFRINDGKPAFRDKSQFEARIRFHEKGLPYPAIGLEARRWLAPNFALEGTLQGYWFNKWNSGRSEGGSTVYDSQAGFETHWRVVYANERLRGFAPFAGVNYYYSKYTQTGSGVGNFLRVQMLGPELGFNFSI
jgi:hypothetical protein